MKEKNKMRKLFQALMVCAIIFSCTSISAQNAPITPEYYSFMPIEASENVDAHTGDFSYSIPLMSVGNNEYPINLFYNSNIGMSQESSWVGLGWNLGIGHINRTVSGSPDDWNKSVINTVSSVTGGVENGNFISFSGTDGIVDMTGAPAQSMTYMLTGTYASYSFTTYGVERTSTNNSNTLGITGTTAHSINAIEDLKDLLERDGQSVSSGFMGGISLNTNSNPEYENKYQSNQIKGQSSNVQSLIVSDFDENEDNIWNIITEFFLQADIGGYTYDFQSLQEVKNFKYGTLYSSNAYKPETTWNKQNKAYSMDVLSVGRMQDRNITTNGPLVPNGSASTVEKHIENNSLKSLAYDNYAVHGQGIIKNIQPRVLQSTYIFGNGSYKGYFESGIVETEEDYYYKDNETIKAQSDIHFVSSDNSSFYREEPGSYNWDIVTNPNNDPLHGHSYSNFSKSTTNSYGESFYDASKDRLGSKQYIEYYTNSEIVNNYAILKQKGFIEDISIHSQRASLPQDGIGAFSVTKADGLTYNYSIPVYQFESMNMTEKIDTPEIFSCEFSRDAYAQNWLLTSITGSDYIDRNNDGYVGTDDYGYWVKFEYGKWADGYIWKTPYEEGEVLDDLPDYENYRIGRKQLYYLDKIETKTHNTFFIKRVKEDGNGKGLNQDWLANFTKGNIDPGAARSILDENGNVIVIPDDDFTTVQNTSISFNSPLPVKGLMLDKIIYCKKGIEIEKDNSITGQTYSFPTTGNISFFSTKSFVDTHDGPLAPVDFNINITDNYASGTFSSHLSNNVLDITDYNHAISNGLLQNADIIKEIEFNYDYSLAKQSPNSVGANNGKLTLNSFSLKGQGAVQSIPDYKFAYGFNPNFDITKMNDYGLYEDLNINSSNGKNAWSLSSITNPLGSSVEVEYETDTYTKHLNVTGLWSNLIGDVLSSGDENDIANTRVKSLSFTNELNLASTVNYDYTSSGMVPYTFPAPEHFDINLLPPPVCYYSEVNKIIKDVNDESYGYKKYKFDDFKPIKKETNQNYSLSRASIPCPQGCVTREDVLLADVTTISDLSSQFGRILSIEDYSSDNLLLNGQYYDYFNEDELIQNGVGVHQESFKTLVGVRYNSEDLTHSESYWNPSTLSIISYPNLVKKITLKGQGVESKITNTKFDIQTGSSVKNESINSYGEKFKYTYKMANEKYLLMGSKLYDINNKNMLIHTTASKTEVEVDGTWKTLNSSVQTWNDDWIYYDFNGTSYDQISPTDQSEKVWRKHKSFVWSGDLNPDGTYSGYSDYDWALDDYSNEQNNGWIKSSEITLYDHFSRPLEMMDANSNYASSKIGYDNNLVIGTVGNANYNSFFASSFEKAFEDHTGYFGGNVKGTTNQTEIESHSGTHSLVLNSETLEVINENCQAGNERNFQAERKYKASVWIKGSGDLKVFTNGSTLEGTSSEVSGVDINGWKLHELYVDIPTANTVHVKLESTSGDTYFDDIRFAPVDAPVVSYVYDKWDQLSYILDNNNLYTRFEYDEAGRLVATFKETVEGEKQISGAKYNYGENN